MGIFKALSITCSLLLSLPLSAQETQYKEKLDSIIYTAATNGKGRSTKNVFYYNRHGQICQIAEYTAKDSAADWRLYSLTQCKYDAEGRNTVWEKSTLKGNTWSTYERIEAEYDSKGNILQTKEYDQYSTMRFTFIYNADSLLQEVTIQALRDGQWESTSKRLYTYSGKNMTSSVSADFEDGTWKEYHKNIYEYDANGNRVKHTFPAAMYYMTYSYDANGRMTNRLTYGQDENGNWDKEPTTERRYTYDAQGNYTGRTDSWILDNEPVQKEVIEYDAATPASQVAGLSNAPTLGWLEILNLVDNLSKYTAKVRSHKINDLNRQASFVSGETTATFYYSAY